VLLGGEGFIDKFRDLLSKKEAIRDKRDTETPAVCM
jgi:hypothetical protein